MRILVIEDDKDVASYLSKGLKESGYVADCADNGKTGLQMAVSEDYDLLIVDRMMPEMGGLEVIRTLREEGYKTPVLVLSA